MSALKILVADDESIIGTMFKRELESKGHNVDVVLNGAEALKLVSSNGYDLVFMDIVMPGMDGIETSKEIKKICPELMVALMTGKIDRDTVNKEAEFVSAGGRVFLYKPFSEDEMNSVIQEALEKKIGKSRSL